MMRNRSNFNSNNRQDGYILPFVLLLLIVLLLSSAAFFNRTTDSAEISGQQRDTTQALILAESVLNRFIGRVMVGVDDDPPKDSTAINDVDGDGDANPDLMQIRALIPVITAAPTGALPGYTYFYGDAGGAVATNATSRILQAVANGESSNTNASVANQQISADTFKAADLFVGATRHPLAFVVNASGIPAVDTTIDTATEWNATSAANGKAAVWLELVVNPNNPQRMNLYAAAATEVGTTKAYLQRRITFLNFDNPDTLGTVAPISESGNRF